MPSNVILNNKKGSPLLISFLASVLTFLCLSAVTPAFAFHFPWDQGHDTTDPNDSEDPGPCEGGDCENDPCNGGSTGSPVYMATGHLIWNEVDIVLIGRPQLAVSRTFNSHDPRVGMLGAGWSMSCDQGLIYTVRYDDINGEPIREYVRRQANGKRYIYSEQPGGTFSAPGLFDVVTRLTDNTARLEQRDGSYSIYGELGNLLSKVDRNNNAVNYSYDPQGRLIQQADEYGRSLTLEYNSNGLVSVIRDHSGREWQYTYDGDAQLISVTDPMSGTRQYDYQQYQPPGDGHTYSHLVRVTDESGVVETEVTYNGSRVASYREMENTFSYQYDLTNRRTTKTDSQGSQWIFTFNETGQVVQETAPLGRTTVFERNGDSLVTKKIDPNGTEYSFTYNEYGHLTSETDGRGSMTVQYADDNPWPEQLTTRLGRVTEVAYDARGNVVSITDAADSVTTLAWSAQGDMTSVANALEASVTMAYSPQGVVTSRSDSVGRTIAYQYDQRNNVTQITNPAGEQRKFEYDQLNRLTAEIDGEGNRTSYTYDAADRLLTVTLHNNTTINNTYDIYGRIATSKRFQHTPIQFTYRSDNLRASVTRPNGTVISSQYDLAKRRIGETVGSEDTFTYTYDVLDRITGITNNTGSVSYTYDDYDRITSETVNGITTTYSYNNEDEITQLTALGIEQTQSFNLRGQLESISTPNANYTYVYDAIGRVTSIAGGSRSTAFTYDSSSQLLSIDHANGRDHGYLYDNNRRIVQWQGVAGETRGYDFDLAGRLTAVSSPTLAVSYAYDGNGNRTSQGAIISLSNELVENSTHQFSYDANGNRTEKIDKTTGVVDRYTYNELDQLIRFQRFPVSSATAPTINVSYEYGPAGKRWRKTDNINGGSTEFYWAGSSLLGEETNSIQRRYVLEGLTPISFIQQGSEYNLQRDHLGTSHEITDSTGSVVWQGDYVSFGSAVISINSIENNTRFPGQYYDAKSELHYNHYRDYDPATGRYLQADPIGMAGGLNPYTYAQNNPLSYSDSEGLILDTIADVGFIIYDLYRIGRDNVFGDCDNLGENLAALGADAAGALIPFASGGGIAVRTGSRVADDVGVIYRVPGSATPSGKPYIGRSDDLASRTTNARDGRDRTQAEVIDTYPRGDREAARRAEQQAINDNGGVPNLDNKRNEIAPSKWNDYGVD